MANLEFLVTDGSYTSELSEPATYIDRSKGQKSVLVVPEQVPDINIETSDVGIRGVQISVRVRVSEVAQPCKGDRLIYHDRDHCVDDFDRLNIAEWLLYVTA